MQNFSSSCMSKSGQPLPFQCPFRCLGLWMSLWRKSGHGKWKVLFSRGLNNNKKDGEENSFLETVSQGGGSPSLASAQIQERSRLKMPDVEQPWLNGWWHGGHKICCWAIWWKAEEQPSWVRKGEPKVSLQNLILDTWESKRLLKNTLTPVGAGSPRYKTASRQSVCFFFFFSIRKCQFITMEMLCRAVSPPWRCEKSQAVFLPNSLAPCRLSWQDAAELPSSNLTLYPTPIPWVPPSLDGQAPADLWRWNSSVLFCSPVWSFFWLRCQSSFSV